MIVAPPNVQCGLFVIDTSAGTRLRWCLYDTDGHLHVESGDLGAVAVAAERLIDATGEAFIVANDNTTARLTETGIETNQPTAGWTRTLTTSRNTP